MAGSSSPPALDSRKRILIEMISREGSFLRKLVSVSRRRVSRVAFGYRFPYARKYFFACTGKHRGTFEIASRRAILHFRRKLRIREKDMKWKAHREEHRYVTKTRFHDRPKAKFNLFREHSIFGAIFFFFLSLSPFFLEWRLERNRTAFLDHMPADHTARG